MSKGKPFPFVLDLLLLQNENTYHYVLIINLKKLVAKVKGREYRDRSELCCNCFHVCSSVGLLTSHQKICLENKSVQITMPTLDKNNVKFENYTARWFSPFVVYLDLESLIVPVATAKNNPTISSTSTLEQHLPCSYCMIVVERDNPEPLHFDIYTLDLIVWNALLQKQRNLQNISISKSGNSHVFSTQHLQETPGQSVGIVMLISTMILKRY